ncbi:hypothetical protein PoB_004173700 [Plakobranchus ocellatus]|uniref:Uncharacterized protein n=1 Tax=Plakobranchus ocellatus TaxID=259542 RepID=A0AAV4B6T3_9GAST|nr:hypothetical protein PoB_004173700 [Plakobranchus ocellatus]
MADEFYLCLSRALADSGSSFGRAVDYQPGGPRYDSQSGPSQIIISFLCTPSTKWRKRRLYDDVYLKHKEKSCERHRKFRPHHEVLQDRASCREFWTNSLVVETLDSESAPRSAGTLLLRVRAPPLAPCLTEGLKT